MRSTNYPFIRLRCLTRLRPGLGHLNKHFGRWSGYMFAEVLLHGKRKTKENYSIILASVKFTLSLSS